jgi:hypothetical protein
MKERKPRTKSKYERDLEGFIQKYIADTGDQSWTTLKVAQWAVSNGLWQQQKINAIKQLMRELSRTARGATFTDEKGNKIRKYHAFRLGPHQPMLWAEMEKIQREQMNESATMRRDKLAAGTVKLWLDVDHFNEHYNPGNPITIDPDFTNDITERTQSDTYDDTPPEMDSAP